MTGAGRASRKAKDSAPDLTDSAVLLCAHGRSDGAAGAAEAHAAALRGRRHFARVDACFLRGRPGVADTLSRIAEARIFLVPLLMADGYTNQVVLPQKLAEAGEPALRVTRCRPVGLSAALAPLATREAAALCRARGWAPADTVVVIAGHGTGRHAESGASAELLAERIAASGRFRRATAAFLEQAPSIEAALRDCRPAPCAVVGFFLDEGGHSDRDVPRLIGAAHPGAAYTGAIGARPGFVEVILDTVSEAARGL